MLSKDPVKRGLNGYPYCGNDPVNHTDPTGEIPTMLAFDAGVAGNLLEQAINRENVNISKGILGGLSNAVSGAIFGNVPFKKAGQAFGKGALAGAATSGLGYLSDLIGRQPKSGQMGHFPGGAVTRTPYERLMDPRGTCILQDIFGGGLGVRKAYGYRYEMRDPDQPERDGFDLGDFLRTSGLSGVAFFGVGKAVKALKGSLSGGSKGGTHVLPNAEDLKMSQTVQNHMNDVIKKGPNAGQLSRPYIDSDGTTLLLNEIMQSADPVSDTIMQSGLRWDVSGTFRGSTGIWELVVDTSTNTVVHYNFVAQ